MTTVTEATVQQLKEYDPKRMKYPCLGQVKMDGIFSRWQPNKGKFFTRSGNEVLGLSKLKKSLGTFDKPLDGELVIPGLNFFEMNGLVRSFHETPNCVFYVFDAPVVNTGYENRQANYYTDPLLNELSTVKPVRAHMLMNEQEADTFYHKVLSAGHEGVVYKQLTAPYKNGKHWEYLKRTPVITCECEIIGYYEGLGKLKGMLGGFLVNFNGVEVKVGGGKGLDYHARSMMWKNREKFIGEPLKCQYKKLTAKGSMRSPQMLGVRWDI